MFRWSSKVKYMQIPYRTSAAQRGRQTGYSVPVLLTNDITASESFPPDFFFWSLL